MIHYFRETVGYVLLVLLLTGLIFGVTVNGKHHQIKCSEDKGVVVE